MWQLGRLCGEGCLQLGHKGKTVTILACFMVVQKCSICCLICFLQESWTFLICTFFKQLNLKEFFDRTGNQIQAFCFVTYSTRDTMLFSAGLLDHQVGPLWETLLPKHGDTYNGKEHGTCFQILALFHLSSVTSDKSHTSTSSINYRNNLTHS